MNEWRTKSAASAAIESVAVRTCSRQLYFQFRHSHVHSLACSLALYPFRQSRSVISTHTHTHTHSKRSFVRFSVRLLLFQHFRLYGSSFDRRHPHRSHNRSLDSSVNRFVFFFATFCLFSRFGFFFVYHRRIVAETDGPLPVSSCLVNAARRTLSPFAARELTLP